MNRFKSPKEWVDIHIHRAQAFVYILILLFLRPLYRPVLFFHGRGLIGIRSIVPQWEAARATSPTFICEPSRRTRLKAADQMTATDPLCERVPSSFLLLLVRHLLLLAWHLFLLASCYDLYT